MTIVTCSAYRREEHRGLAGRVAAAEQMDAAPGNLARFGLRRSVENAAIEEVVASARVEVAVRYAGRE